MTFVFFASGLNEARVDIAADYGPVEFTSPTAGILLHPAWACRFCIIKSPHQLLGLSVTAFAFVSSCRWTYTQRAEMADYARARGGIEAKLTFHPEPDTAHPTAHPPTNTTTPEENPQQ